MTMTTKYKVLIVDDELPALVNMQCLLAGLPDWQLVASCHSSAQAREVLAQQRVDLLLLDIEMPGQSGLDFARELCTGPDAPLIVFITAYDKHAVSAFDVFALDYVLKPFDDERFAQMLARAAQNLQQKQQLAHIDSMRAFLRDRDAFDQGRESPWLTHLVIRSVGRTERVDVSDILWLSSAANYVEVHMARRVVLHRATITAMTSRLPPDVFIRLHRTALVRRSAIVALQVGQDGSHHALLSNGDQVPVSDSYLKQAQQLFA